MSEETKSKFSEGRKNPRPWREVESAVNRSRFSQVPLSGRSIQNFALLNNHRKREDNGARVYFIGSPHDSIKSTLLYIDFSKDHFTEPPPPYPNDYGPTRAALRLVEHVEGGNFNMSKEETLLRERKRMAMIGITSYDLHTESGRFVFPANGKLYTFVDNFTTESYIPYEIESNGTALDPKICPSCPELIAYVNSADLYVAAAPVASNAPPPQVIDSTSLSYRAHATHAKHPLLRLTHVHKGGSATLKEDPISAGVPSFVIQEEFDRFTGYWWQPVQYGGPTPDRFRILYEETDESDVQILNFADTDGQIESYRYPRAGTPNAKSSLKIAEFSFSGRSESSAGELSAVKLYHLAVPLATAFPDRCEYLMRAGWLPDGSAVWAQVTDRLQNRVAFLLLPLDAFVPDQPAPEADKSTAAAAAPVSAAVDASSVDAAATTTVAASATTVPKTDDVPMDQEPSPSAAATSAQANKPSCPYWILYEYTLKYWCEANDLIYFMKSVQTSESPAANEKFVQFVHASPEDGYRHLYLITAAVDTRRALAADVPDKQRVLSARQLGREQLTRGKWEVHAKSSAIWIDEPRRLIYFVAGVASPLLRQLFCVSFDSNVRAQLPDPTHPLLINDNLRSNMFVQAAFVSPDTGCYVTASSSDAMPNSTYVYRIPPEVTDPDLFVKLQKKKQQQQVTSSPEATTVPKTPAAEAPAAEASGPATTAAEAPPAPRCALLREEAYTGPYVTSEELAALVPRPPDHWKKNDMLPEYFTFQAKKPRNWSGEAQKPPPDGYPLIYGMFFKPMPLKPRKHGGGGMIGDVIMFDSDSDSEKHAEPEAQATPMDAESSAAASSDAKQGDQKEEKKETKAEAEKQEVQKEEKPEEKPTEKYPTVVFVYAGPQIQLVTKGSAPSGLLRLRPLLDLGYCVVVLDSRGSSGRGYEFEGAVNRALGSVEVQDQVECVFEVAKELFPQIDTDRIGFYGWSYGGYASLMALAQFPDKVKLAVACAPVTNWELYDTGYTERYLGLPDRDSSAYRMSSVLSWSTRFPAEEGRLLLVHGLQDENVHALHTMDLIKRLTLFGRPYSLIVYPEERHGLRGLDAACHFEVALLSFLEQHL